jgi:hypothetical protein
MTVITLLFTRADHGLIAIESTLRREHPRGRLLRITYSKVHAKVAVLIPESLCHSTK